MNTTIHLLCCKNIYEEVAQAAKSEHLDDLTISTFPSDCTSWRFPTGSPKVAIPPVPGKHGNLFVMSCKTCPVVKSLNIPEERHIAFDNVFDLFLDSKLIAQKISQGGYLVTRGWLTHWRDDSNLSGFTQKDLQTFFKDFAKKIVFIDSSEEPDFKQIYDFSKYIDLPYEHISVGLDYLRLCLTHMSVKWNLTHQGKELHDTIQELSKQVADYAAMVTILNELSMFTTEREVIDKIREILKMLLGATNVTYFTSTSFQEKYPTLHEEILQSDFTYIDDGNGFAYAIRFRNEVLGIFQVTEFLFNRYVQKYLNFCLQTANILAVAIINIRNYRKILDMSLHDSLTGLKNRDYYENHLIEINRNMDCGVGIVVCDIDDLKIVNDTLGHKVGDQLILRLAEILRMSFRDTDTICRIGGDEFVIFVKDCMPESIEAISGRLENNLIKSNALYNRDPENPSLSFSFGVAIHTEGDFDITEIFKTADERMYRKKRERKMTV